MFLSLLCLRQVICVYILPTVVLGTSLPDLFLDKEWGSGTRQNAQFSKSRKQRQSP